MICCRFGKRHGRWERPEKKTRSWGVGANGAFNVESATVGAGISGLVPWAQHCGRFAIRGGAVSDVPRFAPIKRGVSDGRPLSLCCP